MINARQPESIRSPDTVVCDPDHKNMFAAPPAGLLPLPREWASEANPEHTGKWRSHVFMFPYKEGPQTR
jgi:hypothetical protein